MSFISRKAVLFGFWPNRHNLLLAEHGPGFFLKKFLKVYPHEVKILLWVTMIQVIMRISSILMNNVAQTAFLKRYGVESLPTVFLLEAILTLIFASIVGVLMDRHRTTRVFTGLFMFFGITVGLIRFLLPLDILIVYPILYILKSQAVEILPILYWDIMSDLFTTQQSKRLYTLITAGAVLGTTVGSLMTGAVAQWVGVDNVLLVFTGGMALAAVLNEATERVIGIPIEARPRGAGKEKKSMFRENLRQIMAYYKRSSLLKYMILITAIPNILLPVMTYQFNVAVDAYYASEQATIRFFGTFRGISNAAMFVMLLFSGRLIGRWGVARSLLFHPINYLIAFVGLLFRFDLFTAVYARFSTETLKTVLNNPARAILYNFLPEDMRGMVRVFLRGTVVRLSDFVGSGFLILVRGIMDPRLLSVFAVPLGVIWLFACFRIKRQYATMLIQALKEKRIDWNRLEDVDLRAWARDTKAIASFMRGLEGQDHEAALLAGGILSRIRPSGWAGTLIQGLQRRPMDKQKAMLDLLSAEDGPRVRRQLSEMTGTCSPGMLPYLIRTLRRVDAKGSLSVMESFSKHPDPGVQVEALLGLYESGVESAVSVFRAQVEALLAQGEGGERLAMEVLGRAGDPFFTTRLVAWCESGEADPRFWALQGLGKIGHPKALEMSLAALGESKSPRLRLTALDVIVAFGDRAPQEPLLGLLDDEDPQIRRRAAVYMVGRGAGGIQALLPLLASPSRRLRTEVLSILEELKVPSVKISQFILSEVGKAYRMMGAAQAFEGIGGGTALPLLSRRLLERSNEIRDTVLRVLLATEFADQRHAILRAVQSESKRDLDNAIEALGDALHADIGRVFIPLLEDIPTREKLAVAEKRLGMDHHAQKSPQDALLLLLEDADPFLCALSLYVIGEGTFGGITQDQIGRYLGAENRMIAEAALWASRQMTPETPEKGYAAQAPELIHRALEMGKIPLLEGLPVHAIMTIAATARVKNYRRGDLVIREGDPGDALYLVRTGRLDVITGLGADRERTISSLGPGDFVGEMALLSQQPRSASVRAEADALLLTIGAEEFGEIFLEYPSISIHICRELVQRIQTLHGHLTGLEAGRKKGPAPQCAS